MAMKNTMLSILFLWMFLTSALAQDLPNSLKISVDDPKVGPVQLNLYKFNQRSEDFRAYYYENGQLTEFIPGPCRVYRGWSDTYANSQVTAVIYPGNILYGKIDFGKGNVNSIPLENIQLPSNLEEANLVYVAEPQKAEHHGVFGFTTTTDYFNSPPVNGDADVLVAMWENILNQQDLAYASSVGLSFELGAVVIPLDLTGEEVFNPAKYANCPFWTNSFYRTFGGGGVAGRGSLCRGYKGGRTGMGLAGAAAFSHEFGHNLDLGHDHNEWDTMSSNHCYLGFESKQLVKEVLVNGQVGESINNDCLKNAQITYVDPLRPYAAIDVAVTDKNVGITIDVLNNDFDGNQDVLRIKSVDPISKNGATCVVEGNSIRYIPSNNYTGRDYFYYEVESGEPGTRSYLFNYAKVIVDVRQEEDLILHYGFEEPSGNFVFDNASRIDDHNGILVDGNFTASSTSGIVGNALQLNGSTQFVKMKACVDPVDKDMTYAMWFNPSSIPATKTGMTLFDTGNRGLGDHSGININVLPGSIRVTANPICQDRVGYYKTQSVTWQANTWYHVAVVIDRTANTMSAYLNGTEISDSDNFTPYTAEQIIVGHFGEIPKKDVAASAIGCNGSRSSEDFFQGKVDELKVFKSALSESDIVQLYNDRTNTAFVCNKGLKNPVVENSSFEISTVKYTDNVWPVADHWFYSSARKVRVVWGDDKVQYPNAMDGYNWLKLENGYEIYQAIGVYEPNIKLNVSMAIGASLDSPMGECEVSFLTGEANVDLEKKLSDQGLTVLASKTFSDVDLNNQKSAIVEFDVDLGSIGDGCMPLYILIKNKDLLGNELLVDRLEIGQSTGTSISEQSQKRRTISLYPNPCESGQINVVVNGIAGEQIDYEIVDLKGMRQKTGVIPVNCSSMVIDVQALSTGFYFLNCRNSQANSTSKFIVK
jgi:hypothetical protein